jgi:hypothetical protein
LVVVPNFPGPDGWYLPHAETGVPRGREVEESSDARYLYRLNGSSYVGLLVRGDGFGGFDRQYVGANYGASSRFGVVAEVPEGDAAKIQALIDAPASVQSVAKTVVELSGVSPDELRGLLGQFKQNLETLGSAAKDELLTAGRKLEAMLSGADIKG